MCLACYGAPRAAESLHPPAPHRWMPRRAFLLAASSAAASPALAQVQVDEASRLRNLVPAGELEAAAGQQYSQMIAQARQ